MLSYILVVAMLNIVLGFAVAMYIGRRYRAMAAADGVWLAADNALQDDVGLYNDHLAHTDEQLRPMSEVPDAAL